MATITGFIERIKFRNEDNGYTVLSVTDQNDGDEVIMVGTLAYAAEGDMIEASGHMTEHPVYGEQLQIESYEMKTPQDELSMERYLGSGAIKGIGAALAARIVRHFKADTFRVMEEEPERLSEVKGISEKMAMAIAEQVEDKKDMRQAMMFLQNYGITMNLAAKIYQQYGPSLYGIIRENPYRLADDIPGVGFKMADEIAERVGIFTDSDYRIKDEGGGKGLVVQLHAFAVQHGIQVRGQDGICKQLVLTQVTAVNVIQLYFQGFCIIQSLFRILQGNGPQGFIIVSDAEGGRIGQGVVQGNQGIVHFVQEQVVHHLVKMFLGLQRGFLILFVGCRTFCRCSCLVRAVFAWPGTRGHTSGYQRGGQDQ